MLFEGTNYEFIIPAGGENTQKLPKGTYNFHVSTFGVAPLKGKVEVESSSRKEMDIFIRTTTY